jgi:hypothetical protein
MNEPIKYEEWLDALNKSFKKGCIHANQLLPWLLEREWRCINTYLRNPICSTHSLACKTSSHQVAWWICQQVNLRCSHSQCKCLIFVDDLLWNGGGHQCALFLHVEPNWWVWLHSHCHIAMALSWTWFQSHSRWPSSKEFVHNYRRICIRLRRLIMQHYFASLMTIKQVIFTIINKCPKCSSFQCCISHNLSQSIQ